MPAPLPPFDETPCDCDCGCFEPLGTRRIALLPTLLCEDCAHGRCLVPVE